MNVLAINDQIKGTATSKYSASFDTSFFHLQDEIHWSEYQLMYPQASAYQGYRYWNNRADRKI